MCYLLLYTTWSSQQRPCLGFRKGLGYFKHHISGEETLAASSLSWRKRRVSLRKNLESLMVLLYSCSALRAHTLWIISPAWAQEQTQTLLGKVLWGSVTGLVQTRSRRSQSQQKPCGNTGTWTSSNSGVFVWCLEGFTADSCWLWAIFSQDVETIWIRRQNI